MILYKYQCSVAYPPPTSCSGSGSSGVINSPRAQSDRCAEIARQPDESPDDWQQLLEELETLDHVTMIPLDDGAVRLCWNPEEAL